jgi:SAM-dependent methyltransferase
VAVDGKGRASVAPLHKDVVTTVEELQARYYSHHVDDHAVFDAVVRRHLRPDAVILDAGAGRGVRNRYEYADVGAWVVGADLDPSVKENPNLDEAVVADLSHLPFEPGTFDLVFSKYVLEHLERPLATFRELRRVLKGGGHLVFHTPNRFHYVALGATLTPTRFHAWFNHKRGRAEADTFPTRYRANDRRALRDLATRSSFRIVELELIEPSPDYLFFSPWVFRAGIAYERLVNSSERLASLRSVIVGDLVAI